MNTETRKFTTQVEINPHEDGVHCGECEFHNFINYDPEDGFKANFRCRVFPSAKLKMVYPSDNLKFVRRDECLEAESKYKLDKGDK